MVQNNEEAMQTSLKVMKELKHITSNRQRWQVGVVDEPWPNDDSSCSPILKYIFYICANSEGELSLIKYTCEPHIIGNV